MYYKSVNRGLSFTKPGFYAFGLVLVIGMIAVTTGINGLYVFLSAGLGGFIVSGVLSERAMQSCRVVSVGAVLVDAAAPFAVPVIVANDSRWFWVFAMQSAILRERPPFRLIAKAAPAAAHVRVPRLAPATRVTRMANFAGLPRGAYRKLLVMQATTYPFGILEKFKLGEVEASLLVAPAVDGVLLGDLRQVMRRWRQGRAAEQEFYSHMPLRTGTFRGVDWRRSAGKPVAGWVTKQFRAVVPLDRIVVGMPWVHVCGARDAAAYEQLLSRARTALQAVDETGQAYGLDFGSGLYADGRAACLAALAAAPAFAARSQGPGVAAGGIVPAGAWRLEMRQDTFTWLGGDAPGAQPGGT